MCKHNTTALNARLAGGEGSSSAGDEDHAGHEGGAWSNSENKTMTPILAGSPTMGPSSPAKSNDDNGLLESSNSCLKPKEGSSSISTVKMQDGQSFEVGEVRLEGTFTSSSPGRTLYMYSATTTPGEPGVTLQLRDPDEDADVDDKSGSLSSVLARIQGEGGSGAGGTLTIGFGGGVSSEPDIESSIDVLLGPNAISSSTGQANSTGFSGLFTGDGGGDLALSPLAATSDSFLNDNSASPQLSNTDIDTEKNALPENSAKKLEERSLPKLSAGADSKTTAGNLRFVTLQKRPRTFLVHALESNEEEKCGGDSNKLCVKKPRSKASSPNRQGPQQCQTCGKIFGNASALAKHKLTHSDERKYVCTMCGKAFKRQDHLNGHMLTHRNKKPYECRAEGCGKSYCDARSLRRHTENHHSGLHLPNSSAPSPSSSSVSGGLAGLASNGKDDELGGGASPSGANGCIQFAPAPQISSSSMVSSASSALSPDSTASSASVTTPSVNNVTASATVSTNKIHTISHLQQLLASEPTNPSLVTTGSTVSSCLSKIPPSSSKPVECNLCHRKFKNIPALNGHMRLHGGYFKKDSDSKKCEKKEVTGPPLQTASVSVRALIEEKIIQKRTNPSLSTHSLAMQHNSNHVSVATGVTISDHLPTKHVGLTSNFTSGAVRPSDMSLPTSTPSSQLGVDHPLFKRSPNKMIVKRASSDPGLLLPSASNSITTQLHLTLPPKSSSLMDDGYLSPPLPEDVLEQVESVRESMLLQGVDPNQLADSIQAATLQEIASLEEYQSQSPSPRSIQPHQDIQSVLDSPLPVGLADFAYSHSQRNDTDSPLPPGQPYSSSPLPSPSFTYPTPPASQEGHSPSIAPLQSVISNGAVASPLSAAFYTSPMSSSAAVEAALSEVLPPNNYPSSPPTSPLSDSPVPSPLSLPPESTSPLPHHVFQSQMMPNSEDPLLSSSPRDFCPRKRFDFQALKLLTSGTLDFGNAGAQGVTGIVLDRNGELKLIQTSCIQPMKPCSVNTNSSNNNNATLYMNPKPKSDGNICNEVNTKLSTSPMKIPLTLRQMINGHGQSLDSLKEELEDVFFLSPSVPASPVRTKKRLKLENPMTNNSFVSRLRKPREKLSDEEDNLLYTPPPMLPPMRHGRGLYWHTVTPWSSARGAHSDDKSLDKMCLEPAIESDSSAHINVGDEYQATNIPECDPKNYDYNESGSVHERLLWDTSIIKNPVDDKKVSMYLEFACCGAVPGGGRNKEYALHILQMCGGNIHDAMLRLIQPTPALHEDHPLLSFDYPDSERWTSCEIEAFQVAIMKFEKDFSSIAQEIGSKTRKQCVQFYYIWKKLCPEDYKRLRSVNDTDLTTTSSESRLFVCEHQDCSASFNSRAALTGHTRLHLSSTGTRCGTPDRRNYHTSQLPGSETLEEFPCKICGKVFNKVKSRSAHMKSHRPQDGDPRRMRDSTIKIDAIESSSTNRTSPATNNSHRGN